MNNKGNVVRCTPSKPIPTTLYRSFTPISEKVTAFVLDENGNKTRSVDTSVIKHVYEDIMPIPQKLSCHDLDIEALMDAGIDPKDIGKPQLFKINSESPESALSALESLNSVKDKLFTSESTSESTPESIPEPTPEPTK